VPSFKYVAVNELGKEVTGFLDASNEDGATRALESQNLMPLRIENNSDAKGNASFAAVDVKSSRKRKKSLIEI